MNAKYFKEVYLLVIDGHPYVFHDLGEASDFLNYVVKVSDDVTIFFKKSKVLDYSSLDYDEMFHTQLFESWGNVRNNVPAEQ